MVAWKEEVFGQGEVEWRKQLAWLNCRDEQGAWCVSLGKDDPNLRLRVSGGDGEASATDGMGEPEWEGGWNGVLGWEEMLSWRETAEEGLFLPWAAQRCLQVSHNQGPLQEQMVWQLTLTSYIPETTWGALRERERSPLRGFTKISRRLKIYQFGTKSLALFVLSTSEIKLTKRPSSSLSRGVGWHTSHPPFTHATITSANFMLTGAGLGLPRVSFCDRYQGWKWDYWSH